MNTEIEQLYENIRDLFANDRTDEMADLLREEHAADIAEVMELLDDEQRSALFFVVPPRVMAEVVVMLDEAVRSEVVEELDDVSLTNLVNEMSADDAADVVGEMPEELRTEVLEKLPDERTAELTELLEYDEETAGGIMDKQIVALPPNSTVEDAIEALRQADEDEVIDQVYLVDRKGKLLGEVSLRQFLLKPRDTKLADLGELDPLSVDVNADQEEVLNLMRKYDLSSVPVVTGDDNLVGRVTYDDIMDVADEEAAEDLYRMAGTDATELETSSVIRAAFIRLRWVLPCMLVLAGTATVMVIGQEQFPIWLVGAVYSFVPMVAALGGFSGIQVSTIIVRGLSSGDLAGSRFTRVWRREASIVGLMAPVCGLMGWVICILLLPVYEKLGEINADVSALRLSNAVGLGIICAMLMAGSLGAVLPFLFRRFGVDPAVASGPIITTTNDVISVLIYLLIAFGILAHSGPAGETADPIPAHAANVPTDNLRIEQISYSVVSPAPPTAHDIH
jgi:magnesium transporter